MKSIIHTQLRIWMACLLLAGCVTTAMAQAITERMNENMITVSGVVKGVCAWHEHWNRYQL